jgi:Domain of unknown function (DUF4359)
MKVWQLLAIVLGVGGLGLLTNPGRDAYETYAVNRVGSLAKDQCDRAATGLGALLQEPCRAAIEASKPQVRSLLSATTSRQNLLMFSIYRSDISVPAVNFDGRVESIGIFNNFFTYKTP